VAAREGAPVQGADHTARTTLADVASRVGVSVMTVSRVVNERPGVGSETRERVRAAIAELGYRPNIVARGLKVERSRTIGLLVPDVTNPYFPEIVRGAEDVAIRRGYILLLTNVIEDVDREVAAFEAFEDRRVEGVIACSPRLDDERLDALLRRHPPRWSSTAAAAPTPPVRCASTTSTAPACCCATSPPSAAAASRCSPARPTRTPAASGCSASATRPRSAVSRSRRRASSTDRRPWRGARGSPASCSKGDPSIDALVCFNDLVAAGALQAAAEAGRSVPDDLVVTGYDDILFARMFTPPLTTVHAPTYDLGRQAATMLFDRLQGRGRGVDIVLQPELVLRASSARPPAPADERKPR
jgi:LacI family transcriptional regulator